MVRIANDKNMEQLLAELKEYAMEVDMDFVKRAVRAIGQVAIKIDSSAEKCVNVLLDLIATKVHYVIQEAIVVMKDIFRKYPGYEGIIPTLCQCIDELDEPNARSALIWIVGEYAEKISNAGDILSGFVEAFNEEASQVSTTPPLFTNYQLTPSADTTPNPHRRRQTLPQIPLPIPRSRPKSPPSIHHPQRQPRHPRPRLRLLAPPLLRPASGKEHRLVLPTPDHVDHTCTTRPAPGQPHPDPLNPRLSIPETTSDLPRQRPELSTTGSSHRRSEARSTREPNRRSRCIRRSVWRQHTADADHRRESPGHRLRWRGAGINAEGSHWRRIRA